MAKMIFFAPVAEIHGINCTAKANESINKMNWVVNCLNAGLEKNEVTDWKASVRTFARFQELPEGYEYGTGGSHIWLCNEKKERIWIAYRIVGHTD